MRHIIVAASLATLTPASVHAAEEGASQSFFDESRWIAEARYRFETVDVDNALQTAYASTLRTQAGFETNPELAVSALVEAEDVHAIGEERFNSTTNDRGQYDVVPDPDGTELNQAYLTLRGGGLRARAGRQSIALDNERFIGNVDFRQNEQTYDAVMMQANTGGNRFTYGYLRRVHRFLGEDHPLGRLDLRTHLLNYSWNRLNADRLTAYVYLLEFDEPDLRAAATQTYGVSYDGSFDFATRKLLYRAEYANQTDYADNPAQLDVWYANLEIGFRFANQWVITAGAELLSGDGASAFQTPLATLHKFNGFADVFAAATPPDGLQDLKLRMYLPILGTRLTISLHDFVSDNASLDYGREVDAELNWRLGSHWMVGVKYAEYSAEEFAADTRKGWVWLQAAF